jgi:putative addiction module component (TIGR02574 family)
VWSVDVDGTITALAERVRDFQRDDPSWKGRVTGDMDMQLEDLLVAALDLPAVERFYLATRLMDSVPTADLRGSAEVSAQFQELDRRVADLKNVHRAEDSWQDG